MSMRASRWSAIVVALGLALPAPASADSGDETKARAEARRYAEEGRALLDHGKPREALDSLRKAEAAFHAPTIVLLMAQARRDLGQMRAAVALYRRVLAEPLPKDASPAFRSAHEMALIELREAQEKVGLVDLVVRPVGVAAVVTIGGDEIAGAGPYEVDPGVATPIGVSAQGYEPAEETVTIPRGIRRRVEIELRPTGTTFERASRSPTPVIVGATLLVAGLAVAIPTGVAALDRKRELLAVCPGGVCPASATDARSMHASATLLADVSTAGIVVAGAGAALATIFLISSKGGRRWSTASVQVTPTVTFGGAGLSGSF